MHCTNLKAIKVSLSIVSPNPKSDRRQSKPTSEIETLHGLQIDDEVCCKSCGMPFPSFFLLPAPRAVIAKQRVY